MTNTIVTDSKQKIQKKEVFGFLLLFLSTIISVYFIPQIINKLFFLVVLFIFWKSKKDYFWFAFVFIVCSKPGYLFFGRAPFDIHIVPYYSLTKGLSFSFFELFFILAFIKVIFKGKIYKPILKKPMFYLLLYLIFLFLFSFLYGMNYQLIVSSLRALVPFTLFVSFLSLVRKRKDFYKFAHLIFSIMFIIIISQFLMISTGENFHTFLSSETTPTITQFEKQLSYEVVRPMPGGAMIIIFSFIFSLFYIEDKDYLGNKYYLFIILFTSILSIFLSATRGWIFMFAIVLFLYVIFISRKKFQIAIFLILIISLLSSSYIINSKLKSSMNYSLNRLTTMKDLIEGDMTARGTLIRINIRLPKVWEGFIQNPLFGWGFSDTYYKYSDAHVGIFNVMLQVGIVGILLFVNLWIYYIKIVFLTIKKLGENHFLKNSMKILIITFLGILILHSTTFAFFAFDLRVDTIFFIIVFFCYSEFFVKYALSNKILIKRGQNESFNFSWGSRDQTGFPFRANSQTHD